jgi:hypothetical protein
MLLVLGHHLFQSLRKKLRQLSRLHQLLHLHLQLL